MSIVSTKHGKMRIIDADKVVSHALELYGEWAMDELNLLVQLITPGMCVLDVGAFIGTHSLAFSRFVGEAGKVYSFEPRKEIHEILLENLQGNNCKNTIAMNIGLAEIESDIYLPSINLNNSVNFGGLSLDDDFFSPDTNTYQVHISSIDNLDIEQIDLIKLDVEGMERRVLDGAFKSIARDRPIIFCECNSLNAGNEILEFCKSIKYDVYGFLASAYNPDNINSVTENIFGEAKELAFLLIPEERNEVTIGKINNAQLFPINNLEDLVLPLLHKPQYPYEVLINTSTHLSLGINFPSPIIVQYNEKIISLNQAIVDCQKKLTNQDQAIIEQNEKIVFANKATVILDSEISKLSQTIAIRDGDISKLSQTIASRDSEISKLSQTIAVRDSEISELSQILVRLEMKVTETDQNVTMWNDEITSATQAITQRDIYIHQLISSKSWLITKPVRWLGRIIRGDFAAALDPITRTFSALLSLRHNNKSETIEIKKRSVEILPIKPTHPVAVILPIYRGVEMTKRCIFAAMPDILKIPNSHIVAINDASPDAGMQEMLDEIAAIWPNIFIALSNEKNLGFVGTVNRGLAHFPKHDSVLLNSDVIVPKDWLSRLIDEAYSQSKIGTVTPFSNNATICSFPNFLQENKQAFNLDVDTVDAVFRAEKLPCFEAPTGVGFCMYIRRACLDEIGYLNQEKFGRGYGEENDLCQRALKRGWLNIISPNIYAYHEGSVSFSSDKHALVERSMQVIDELHPNYHADIQLFIRNDPAKSARVARFIQLLSATAIPKILHITHVVGGGVAQHISELSQYFNHGIAHLLLTPNNADGSVCISLSTNQYADKLIFEMPSGYANMLLLLKSIGITAVHIHHTMGLYPGIFRLPNDLAVPHILTAHDYYWLNANPTLTDKNGRYPGFYSDSQSNPLYPLPSNMTTLTWQEQLRPLMESAVQVIFPSNATKSLFDKVYDLGNAVIAPHIESQLDMAKKPLNLTKKDCYVIGVIGAIGREKGADILEEIAEMAKEFKAPIRFKLIGYAYRPLKEVETTGPYQSNDLTLLMQQHDLDIIFFPAQCPETYSYTLSRALDSGLPIIAADIGAFPERLSGRANTLLFNHLSPVNELLEQINKFIEDISNKVLITAPVFDSDKSKDDFYECDYVPLISQNLSAINSKKKAFFDLKSVNIVGGLTNENTWRNLLLRTLWRLYMNPSTLWIANKIPYWIRRKVKRSLSRNSIHDLST